MYSFLVYQRAESQVSDQSQKQHNIKTQTNTIIIITTIIIIIIIIIINNVRKQHMQNMSSM